MKRLKKFISRFMWMILACAILSACSEDEKWDNSIKEGLPISLNFKLTTPAPNEVQTRATDEQETKVEKLALFFYKDAASLPLVHEVSSEELTEHSGDGTHYTYSISVPETVGITSGKWYIYAVANWNKGFWDSSLKLSQLAAMTKDEMDEFCILKKYNTAEITETSILLSGKYGSKDGQATLEWTPENQGVNTLVEPIHLKRSIAKIIFQFLTGPGVEFVPQTFDIYNYCRTSTLIEREGWEGMANPGNLQWKGVEDKENFVNSLGVPVPEKGIVFYMPENVQQPQKGMKPDNIAMREKKGVDGTFEFAPEKASYIVVHGKYKGPGEDGKTAIGNVDYTIHFGDFSVNTKENPKATGKVDNFTVRRNSKYTFKVTINGVKNIIIEAKTSTENQPGAEGDIINTDQSAEHKLLDSHYETCIIKLPLSSVNKTKGYGLILKTPYSNYASNQIVAGDLVKEDVDWVEFCKPKSPTQTVKYPGQKALKKENTQGKKLLSLPELLEEFYSINPTETHKEYPYFIVEGDFVYVQAFVNEYFYKDKDLNSFINAPNRIMTVAGGTYISSDGKSTYTSTPLFTLEQRSIKSMYNLSVANNPFGLECTEDGDQPIIIGPNSADTYKGDLKDDGRANFIANLKSNNSWETYVDYANNTLKDQYNYGIYQGLLRNRDLNGDGKIQPEEIKWFLPSVNQHIAIWNGYHALTEEARLNKGDLYFTSTNGQFRTMWAKEGAFGAYKLDDQLGRERVRCIRALKQFDAKTTRSTVYDPQTRIFTVSGFGPKAIRQSGSHNGEYIYHSQFSAENKLPEAFQMAEKNLIVTIGGTPGKPKDDFVPEVTIDPKSIDDSKKANVKIETKISITNAEGHTFYSNTTEPSLIGARKIEKLDGFKVVIEGKGTNSDTGVDTNKGLYIIADNGNYVELYLAKRKKYGRIYTYSVKQKSTVIPANEGTKPIEGSKKSTFTLEEITQTNICADYYENGDESQKGQWRVPNQRELMIMFMFSQNAGESNSYKLSQKTATRTYYDGRGKDEAESKAKGMFFIQVATNAAGDIITDEQGGMGAFITSGNDKGITEFVVRPVRDVQPQP